MFFNGKQFRIEEVSFYFTDDEAVMYSLSFASGESLIIDGSGEAVTERSF